MATTPTTYTRKDFTSDQTVRWCPGCGDYAILKAIQAAMPQTGVKKEDTVFISGIGCAARFPYYMDTYGFHTVHGRAPALALGTKIANPDLQVWIITGDGDALAIGGNHFVHAFRRNIDVNILLFNNEVYGLTKGQYSPTSRMGQVTKSSPQGVIDAPFLPAELALGAGCRFFARVPDRDAKYMEKVFVETSRYKGAALVEILQNCPIFNDGAHDLVTLKQNAPVAQIRLEHGQPMLFGPENEKGLVLDGLSLKVVTLGEDGITEADILVHDAHNPDPTLHRMLAGMAAPDFPVAMGIIRAVEGPTYDQLLFRQLELEKETEQFATLDEMFFGGETWEIE